MKSAQTLIRRDSVTIQSDELNEVLPALSILLEFLMTSKETQGLKNLDFDYFHADSFKKLVHHFQSGDACRHPVQSPDVVGQGGINV